MPATYLAVRYEEREQAKSLGARWDRATKSWFVPDGQDTEPFRQWLRSESPAQDPRQQFAAELRKAGFRVDGQHPMMDGKIHRIAVDGDKGIERNGSYRGFLDGVPNGWHQNFKATDNPVPWKAMTSEGMPLAERSTISATAAANLQQAAETRNQDAARAAQTAVEILKAATPATAHSYLADKGVKSYGLFIAGPGTTVETENGRHIDVSGKLLVPIRDINGAVTSLQMINDAGRKMFLRGGKISGGHHVIGDISSPWPMVIAEGYATAATIHEATGQAVVVAFTAHNLGVVAAQYRSAYPERSIFIAADNDHHLPTQTDPQGRSKRNIGLEAATAAAAAIDGYALIPDPVSLGRDHADEGTDWNDAMKERGMAAVQVGLAVQQAAGARLKIAKDIVQNRGYGRAEEQARSRETVAR